MSEAFKKLCAQEINKGVDAFNSQTDNLFEAGHVNWWDIEVFYGGPAGGSMGSK